MVHYYIYLTLSHIKYAMGTTCKATYHSLTVTYVKRQTNWCLTTWLNIEPPATSVSLVRKVKCKIKNKKGANQEGTFWCKINIHFLHNQIFLWSTSFSYTHTWNYICSLLFVVKTISREYEDKWTEKSCSRHTKKWDSLLLQMMCCETHLFGRWGVQMVCTRWW